MFEVLKGQVLRSAGRMNAVCRNYFMLVACEFDPCIEEHIDCPVKTRRARSRGNGGGGLNRLLLLWCLPFARVCPSIIGSRPRRRGL